MTSDQSITPLTNSPVAWQATKRARLTDLCIAVPQGHGSLLPGSVSAAVPSFGLFPSGLPDCLPAHELSGSSQSPTVPQHPTNNFLCSIGQTDEYLAYGATQQQQPGQTFQPARPTPPVMQSWFPGPAGPSPDRRQAIGAADRMPSSDLHLPHLFIGSPTGHQRQDYSQLNNDHRFMPQMHQDLTYSSLFNQTTGSQAPPPGSTNFLPHMPPQRCFNGQPATAVPLLQQQPAFPLHHPPPGHVAQVSPPDGSLGYTRPTAQSPTPQQLVPTDYAQHSSLSTNQFTASLQPMVPNSSGGDQLYLAGLSNSSHANAHSPRFNGGKERSRVAPHQPAPTGHRAPLTADEGMAPTADCSQSSETSDSSDDAGTVEISSAEAGDSPRCGEYDDEDESDVSDWDLVDDDDEDDLDLDDEEEDQLIGVAFAEQQPGGPAEARSREENWASSGHLPRRQFSMAELLRLAGEHDHRVTDLLVRFIPQLKSYLTQQQQVGTGRPQGQQTGITPSPSISSLGQLMHAINGDGYHNQLTGAAATAVHNGVGYADVTTTTPGPQPGVNGGERNRSSGGLHSAATECLVKSLCCLLENCLFSLVDWVGQTEMFKVIPVDEKMQLLNSSWSEIILLEYIHHYVTHSCHSTSSSGSDSPSNNNSGANTEEESTMLADQPQDKSTVPYTNNNTDNPHALAVNTSVSSTAEDASRHPPATNAGVVSEFCELADSVLDHLLLLLPQHPSGSDGPALDVNSPVAPDSASGRPVNAGGGTVGAAIAAAAGVSGVNASDCRRKLDDLIGQFDKLQLTSDEFTCLKFLVLFNPAKHDLRITPDALRHIQWVQSKLYAFLLRHSRRCLLKVPVEPNCPPISSADYLITLIADRFGKLLLQLTEIKQLAFHMESYLLSRYREGKIPHESLLTEMLLTKRQVHAHQFAGSTTAVVGGGGSQMSMPSTGGDTSSSSCMKPDEEDEEVDGLEGSGEHLQGSSVRQPTYGQQSVSSYLPAAQHPGMRVPASNEFGAHALGHAPANNGLLVLPNGALAFDHHALSRLGSD